MIGLFLTCSNFSFSVDAESNRTDSIVKIISGLFYQGNSKFGYTAGIRCASDSFDALCWPQVKKV